MLSSDPETDAAFGKYLKQNCPDKFSFSIMPFEYCDTDRKSFTKYFWCIKVERQGDNQEYLLKIADVFLNEAMGELRPVCAATTSFFAAFKDPKISNVQRLSDKLWESAEQATNYQKSYTAEDQNNEALKDYLLPQFRERLSPENKKNSRMKPILR